MPQVGEPFQPFQKFVPKGVPSCAALCYLFERQRGFLQFGSEFHEIVRPDIAAPGLPKLLAQFPLEGRELFLEHLSATLEFAQFFAQSACIVARLRENLPHIVGSLSYTVEDRVDLRNDIRVFPGLKSGLGSQFGLLFLQKRVGRADKGVRSIGDSRSLRHVRIELHLTPEFLLDAILLKKFQTKFRVFPLALVFLLQRIEVFQFVETRHYVQHPLALGVNLPANGIKSGTQQAFHQLAFGAFVPFHQFLLAEEKRIPQRNAHAGT